MQEHELFIVYTYKDISYSDKDMGSSYTRTQVIHKRKTVIHKGGKLYIHGK